METSRICVSGVAGFLGSHLADAFIKKGHEVIGCDNLAGGSLDNISKDITFHKWDCTDLPKMNKLTKGCDVVYHLAALAHEGLSVFSPHLITQSVFNTSVSMISASINQKVRRFVYASSMARYGSQGCTLFREDMLCNPQDPYGIAKYAGEQVIRHLGDVHNFEWSIAVPHNIIGPRQKYDDPFRNVASIFINRMMQGKQPIIYGDGTQQRCFSFVQDCLQCLVKMGFIDDANKQVINIGPDEEVINVNILGETIAKLLDFEYRPIYMGSRPKEVWAASCSSDKARKLLGYKTEYTLEKGLKEMIEFIKEKGPKPFDYSLPIEINNDSLPVVWRDKML